MLPFENEREYREFAIAVERDYAPAGIVQRELVSHITQLLWKLRRIPAIEQALLQSQQEELQEQFEEDKRRWRIDRDATLEAPTTAKLLGVEFASKDGFGYQRLETYRYRLKHGLHAAMRQLKKAREETQGEELSRSRSRRQYAIQAFGRVVEQAREIRAMKEAMQKQADAKAAAEASKTTRPAATCDAAKCVSPSKATDDRGGDKYGLKREKCEQPQRRCRLNHPEMIPRRREPRMNRLTRSASAPVLMTHVPAALGHSERIRQGSSHPGK